MEITREFWVQVMELPEMYFDLTDVALEQLVSSESIL